MSPQDVATLRQVSPSSAVAALDTELFIMHDRSDPYIPYVESRRLRDAAVGNSYQV
jgi:predicted esterase